MSFRVWGWGKGDGARRAGGSEPERPGVDVAGVVDPVVAHPELPGAVRGLAGGVDRERVPDVVGAVVGRVVLQQEDVAVGGDEFDPEVAAVGVADVDGDGEVGGRVAADAGDREGDSTVAPSRIG